MSFRSGEQDGFPDERRLHWTGLSCAGGTFIARQKRLGNLSATVCQCQSHSQRTIYIQRVRMPETTVRLISSTPLILLKVSNGSSRCSSSSRYDTVQPLRLVWLLSAKRLPYRGGSYVVNSSLLPVNFPREIISTTCDRLILTCHQWADSS